MRSVTIVIPVFELTEYRLRNFEFVYNKIKNLPCKVIVAEQVTSTNNSCLEYKGYETTPVEIPEEIFCKSILYNRVVDQIDTYYTWFVDCDFYAPYQKIYDKISDHDLDFFQPYNMSKDLNEILTNQLIKEQTITDKMLQDNYVSDRKIDMLGSLSMLCKTQSYRDSGGLDENYKGWGLEDIDFFLKLFKNGFKLGKESEILGVHLWHPRTRTMNNSGAQNLKYFKSKGYTTGQAKELHRQILKH